MLSLELTHKLDAVDRGAVDALIRRFWAARLADAPAAIVQHTTSDIVFRIIGGGGPSGESVCEGQEAVLEAVRAIDTNLAFLSFDILDLIVDGRKAALLWRAELRHRGTGATGELSVFDLITVENGRIASYTEFLDSDCFQRLMRGDPQPPLARRSNCTPSATKPSDLGQPDLVARDRTEAMLRAFWDRRLAVGGQAISEFCGDVCELQLVGDPATVPFARHHEGVEAVSALVQQIDMEFECKRFAIRHVLVDGDRAALHWVGDVRHRGTGASGSVQALDHVTFVDGRIRSITEFFDTAATVGWIEG